MRPTAGPTSKGHKEVADDNRLVAALKAMVREATEYTGRDNAISREVLAEARAAIEEATQGDLRLDAAFALRIDRERGIVALDGVSGGGGLDDAWRLIDLTGGTYGDFHRLRPASECSFNCGEHIEERKPNRSPANRFKDGICYAWFIDSEGNSDAECELEAGHEGPHMWQVEPGPVEEAQRDEIKYTPEQEARIRENLSRVRMMERTAAVPAEVAAVPPRWREGDPPPPDATYVITGAVDTGSGSWGAIVPASITDPQARAAWEWAKTLVDSRIAVVAIQAFNAGAEWARDSEGTQ